MKVRNRSSAERGCSSEHAELDPLARMLEQDTRASFAATFTGAVVGEVSGQSDASRTFVTFEGQAGTVPVEARSVVRLPQPPDRQKVVLLFENADPSKPIIVGVLPAERGPRAESVGPRFEIEADGNIVNVEAREQLVLRCGAASITLTRAGKVLIKGEYVSTRSNGVNRIRGGSVQIN